MEDIFRSRMKKHIGTVKNTGARIYLVFRQLKEDPSSCLVVMADSLPDQYSDNMHGLVMGREAQETVDLFEVLHRHRFPSGDNVLHTLHEKGFLVKVPISNIAMEALPGHRTELSLINASLNGEAEAAAESIAELSPAEPVISKSLSAMDLLAEANDLEARAKQLRTQAKILDPKVVVKKPAGRPDSGLSADEKREIRNKQRRDRYQGKSKP